MKFKFVLVLLASIVTYADISFNKESTKIPNKTELHNQTEMLKSKISDLEKKVDSLTQTIESMQLKKEINLTEKKSKPVKVKKQIEKKIPHDTDQKDLELTANEQAMLDSFIE